MKIKTSSFWRKTQKLNNERAKKNKWIDQQGNKVTNLKWGQYGKRLQMDFTKILREKFT